MTGEERARLRELVDEARRRKLRTKTCPVCGATFEATNARKAFCRRSCQHKSAAVRFGGAPSPVLGDGEAA